MTKSLASQRWQKLGLERPILKGKANFPACLAPMVGLSHVCLRRLVRDYLPRNAHTIWPTEMLNSRRIPSENLEKTPETLKSQNETGLVPQILGNEEKFIAPTVRRLEEWGAVGIDINMGCPVKKALQHNYGVALMGDPDYAARVVEMTVRSSKVPVSVKLRSGERADMKYLLDFVKGIESAGASWITLHPRLSSQMRRGAADWEHIRTVRDHLKIPVIGNGDIQVADDVFEMLNQTNCDMVMVGRALTARPWLLWQVGERLGFEPPIGATSGAPTTPLKEGEEYGKALVKMLGFMRESFSADLGYRKFRFFVKTGCQWLEFGHALLAGVSKAKTLDECELFILKFFEKPQRMMGSTELRQ